MAQQVDLSYHDLFGNLKLVLLNCDKLPLKQEVFMFAKKINIIMNINEWHSCFMQGLKDALAEIVDSKQVIHRFKYQVIYIPERSDVYDSHRIDYYKINY